MDADQALEELIKDVEKENIKNSKWRLYKRHQEKTRNYGPNWKKQRLEALARDGCQCQYCKKFPISGSGIILNVHHIIPFRRFGLERYKEANRLENLITLCARHHKKLENKPEKCKILLKINRKW